MASFECKVCEITIEKHPDPEVNRLELARIGGYVSIVPIDKYKTGDKVVYIPEQAVVPEELLKEMGLEGKLAGSKKNRVKAIKLRGVLSQGLVHSAKDEWNIGDDVKEELGIVKYEPPIPTHLGGEVDSWDVSIKFDIENIKKYPEVIQEGEDVILTEKIHGTCTVSSFVPEACKDLRKETMIDGKWAISSKGLSHKQLFFKDTEENRASNLYIKAFNEKIREMLELEFSKYEEVVTFVGESFGRVQDLK